MLKRMGLASALIWLAMVPVTARAADDALQKALKALAVKQRQTHAVIAASGNSLLAAAGGNSLVGTFVAAGGNSLSGTYVVASGNSLSGTYVAASGNSVAGIFVAANGNSVAGTIISASGNSLAGSIFSASGNNVAGIFSVASGNSVAGIFIAASGNSVAGTLAAGMAANTLTFFAARTAWLSILTAAARPLPGDPMALTATASAEDFILSWANTPSARASFLILRSEAGQSLTARATLTPPTTTYRDLTVTPGTLYEYQAQSLDDKGNTLCVSQVIQVRLLASMPPIRPEELLGEADDERAHLKWKPVPRVSHDVAGYVVYRAPYSGGEALPINAKLATKPEYYDEKGAYNEKYLYRVAAVDTWGQTGEASTTVTAWARPRGREALVLMSTAYRGQGLTDSGLNASAQFTYFIGTLYSELSPELLGERAATSLYLDPISLWLLTVDAKYTLALEDKWPCSVAAGAKGSILLFAGQQSTTGSFTFSSKSTFQTLWGGYLALSRTFGNWGAHGGVLLGPEGNVLYYLSKYLTTESTHELAYVGVDFPIVRRFNAALEIIYPLNLNPESQHTFLINSHIDRLFQFDVSYLHWDYGWAFLGYFNLRFTVFPGSSQ